MPGPWISWSISSCGREVAGLRAEDGDGVAARGVLAGDHERVGHAALAAEQIPGQYPVVVDAAQLVELGGRLDRGGGPRPWPRWRRRCGRRRAARGVTEPGSGMAVPCGVGGLVRVREALPSWTVRTASGSLRCRKDSQTLVPSSTPYFCWAASSDSAPLHLAAPAVAEERADDGGQGDQVGELEGLDLAGVGDRVDVAGEHVLAGEVAAVLRTARCRR